MVITVREYYVLEHAPAVQDHVLHLIIMGNQVDVREAKAMKPALIIRVDGFSGEFRMRIHSVCAVHAARAASHDNAVVALQQLPEPYLVQELVLCGNMPAAEDYPVCR